MTENKIPKTDVDKEFLKNIDQNQVALALAVKEIFTNVIKNIVSANSSDTKSEINNDNIRLFSLVKSEKLLQLQHLDPDLKEILEESVKFIPTHLSSVEQDIQPQPLEDLLHQIQWNEDVDGCAVAIIKYAVDSNVNKQAPENDEEKIKYFENNHLLTRVCICAGVDKNGAKWTIVKKLDKNIDPNDLEETKSGIELLPNLTEALLETFI